MIESKLRGMNSGGGVIDFVGGVSLPAGYTHSGDFYYSNIVGGYIFDVSGAESVNFAIMSGRGGNCLSPSTVDGWGGQAGYIIGSIDLSAINSLYVVRGGMGEWKLPNTGLSPAAGGIYGGGDSGTPYVTQFSNTYNHRAGGGGASFIGIGTTVPSAGNMIAIPGAGGGQGHAPYPNGYGGAGGGANMNGSSGYSYLSYGGGGGTSSAGGNPATNGSASYWGAYATAGGFLSGGNGRSSALDQGGGGGSGWYGGGGGKGGGGYSSGGGGGGSGYANLSIVSVTHTGTGITVHPSSTLTNTTANTMKYNLDAHGINLPNVPTDGSGYVAFWN
jgi:hypothetical protein